MTKPPEKYDDPIYVADPAKEKQAKTLHFMVSVIRLLGIAILMLGIAIALGRLASIPAVVGYVLVVIGLAQTWVIPFVMVRSFVKQQVAEEADKEATDEKIL